MRESDFGSILAEARTGCGYSVNDIARMLSIRADIVRSIERSDLHSLPPRAYTKNMILQYARIVKLNPESLAKMYEDASYNLDVHEIRKKGDSSQKTGQRGTVALRAAVNRDENCGTGNQQTSYQQYDSHGSNQPDDASPLRMPTSRMSSAYSLPHDNWDSEYGNGYANSVSGRISLSMQDDRYVDAGPVTDNLSGAPSGSSRSFSARNSTGRGKRGRTSARDDYFADGRRSKRTPQYSGTLPTASYVNNHYSNRSYSKSRSSGISRKPLIIVIAFILIVVLVAVVFAVTSNGNKKIKDTSTKTPITGLTDTTSSDDSLESLAIPVAPTAAEFAYSVNSGVETYVEIYLDDSDTATLAQVLTGPTKGSYSVTGKLKFVCTQPDGVKLTVDGEAVTMTPNEKTNWIYEYELDFAEYLAKWQSDHAAEIAAAQKAKEELLASQNTSSASPSSSSGSSSTSSTSGKTTTSH